MRKILRLRIFAIPVCNQHSHVSNAKKWFMNENFHSLNAVHRAWQLPDSVLCAGLITKTKRNHKKSVRHNKKNSLNGWIVQQFVSACKEFLVTNCTNFANFVTSNLKKESIMY